MAEVLQQGTTGIITGGGAMDGSADNGLVELPKLYKRGAVAREVMVDTNQAGVTVAVINKVLADKETLVPIFAFPSSATRWKVLFDTHIYLAPGETIAITTSGVGLGDPQVGYVYFTGVGG